MLTKPTNALIELESILSRVKYILTTLESSWTNPKKASVKTTSISRKSEATNPVPGTNFFTNANGRWNMPVKPLSNAGNSSSLQLNTHHLVLEHTTAVSENQELIRSDSEVSEKNHTSSKSRHSFASPGKGLVDQKSTLSSLNNNIAKLDQSFIQLDHSFTQLEGSFAQLGAIVSRTDHALAKLNSSLSEAEASWYKPRSASTIANDEPRGDLLEPESIHTEMEDLMIQDKLEDISTMTEGQKSVALHGFSEMDDVLTTPDNKGTLNSTRRIALYIYSMNNVSRSQHHVNGLVSINMQFY